MENISSSPVDQYLSQLIESYQAKLIQQPEQLPPPLPPKTDAIRFINKNHNDYREKFDGISWKPVCRWQDGTCTNFVKEHLLCAKHCLHRQNNEIQSDTSTDDSLPLPTQTTEHNILPQHNQPNEKFFKQFSIESDDDDLVNIPITEPTNQSENDDFSTKNIPPLTKSDKIYLSNFLVETCPIQSLIVDARKLFNEKLIQILHQNYQIQLKTISSDYYYHFLLRYPRLAIHFHQWFLPCKPIPPPTDSSNEMAKWTLGMMLQRIIATHAPHST